MDLLAKVKERRLHKERLVKAAGVTTVPLVCTDDTWTFIHSQSVSGVSGVAFEKGAAKRRDDGLVEIPFSGPKLVKLLTALRSTHSAYMISHPHWALSKRVYDAVGEVIDQIDLAQPDGKQLPPIVIDARLSGQ